MPRKKFIFTDWAPYHVTARANNKDWFSLPMTEMWSIYESLLIRTTEKYGFLLHAFVLMSNHFHVIATTPNKNLSAAMRYLLTEVSRAVGRKTQRINHIFGGRYKWSVLWTPRDVAYVYKYVIRNPIRSGLCQKAEDYPFSSFSRMLRNQCSLPITDGIGESWGCIPRDPATQACWINSAPVSEAEQLISLGLRRYEFMLPKHNEVLFLRSQLAVDYQVENPSNEY